MDLIDLAQDTREYVRGKSAKGTFALFSVSFIILIKRWKHNLTPGVHQLRVCVWWGRGEGGKWPILFPLYIDNFTFFWYRQILYFSWILCVYWLWSCGPQTIKRPRSSDTGWCASFIWWSDGVRSQCQLCIHHNYYEVSFADKLFTVMVLLLVIVFIRPLYFLVGVRA